MITSRGPVTTKSLIWAAGEFQYPQFDPFPGAEYCRHNATVPSWRDVSEDDVVVLVLHFQIWWCGTVGLVQKMAAGQRDTRLNE